MSSSSLTRFQDSEKLARDIDTFARKLDELRLAYDQYFNGVSREEPTKQREEVFSYVRALSGVGLQNARLRFKLQQTIAKYNTYVTLWDRILREIEEGRYKRDLFRLRLHYGNEDPKNPAGSAASTKSAEPKGKSPAEQADPSPRPTNDPFESLYSQFVLAKKACKEPTDGLSFETFKKGLVTQVQKIQSQLKGKKVKFQISTEGGKATIKLQAK